MLRITSLLIFINLFSFAQENTRIVDFDDTYLKNELLYEVNNDKLYTGLIHRTKKNEQLVQEDYVEKGVIHYTQMFYRKGNRIPYSKYIYNKDNPYVLKQVSKYHFEGDIYEIIYYDYNGRKILEENFEDGKLIYSCEFDGRKRHGREFCITEKCDTTFVYYLKGKKQKNNMLQKTLNFD